MWRYRLLTAALFVAALKLADVDAHASVTLQLRLLLAIVAAGCAGMIWQKHLSMQPPPTKFRSFRLAKGVDKW